MKKVILLIGFIAMCLLSQSQTSRSIVSSDSSAVINKSMIERFNSIEYSPDQADFAYILENYSFSDAKNILMAYESGNIEDLTGTSIDAYLAKYTASNNQDTYIGLPKQTENQLLATQQ
jgi:hypothetical protein